MKVLFVAGIGVACVVLVIFMMTLSPITPVNQEQSSENDALFTTYDEAVAAYTQLSTEIEPLEAFQQHELVHRFGKKLFQSLGKEGLTVCDDKFLYGCIHEFIAQAILRDGLEALPDLDTRCLAMGKQASFCQHGFGHAIVGFVGYETKDLEEALAICDSLTKLSPYGGCRGGAFMEHNLRLMTHSEYNMMNPDASTVRTADDLGEPCKDLPTQYRNSCSYRLPEWWQNGVLHAVTDRHEQATRLGEYCRTHTKTDETYQSCLRGVGFVLATTASYEPEVIQSLCHAATAHDPHSNGYCISEAASRTATQGDTAAALTLCESLGPNDAGRCVTTD